MPLVRIIRVSLPPMITWVVLEVVDSQQEATTPSRSAPGVPDQ